jgi:hypothetical protein
MGMLLALMAMPGDAEGYREASDDLLLELTWCVAEQERIIAGHKAMLAGEIGRRSRGELGYSGLAQRKGHRTAEELLRVTTGSTLRDAKVAVEVGRMAAEAAEVAVVDPATGEAAATSQPWMNDVATSATTGRISLTQAIAIREGLGAAGSEITAEILGDAADVLHEAALDGLDADRLRKRAQELRDELDEAGIADREAARVQLRSFKLTRLPDGMTRVTWLMDPETAAIVAEIRDRAVSPKLGGPRFVESGMAERAERIERDTRTPEQLTSDVFLQLLRNGCEVDTDLLVGVGVPAVRVLVTGRAFERRSGHARIEGQSNPVSLATAERIACTAGTSDIVFDEEFRPLDVGRDLRLYTKKQRIAMAARDGGCMFPGCDRPPSWTEAHHIKHWVRDHGPTNVDEGILLCRHHHRLMHHGGWEITRVGGEFDLIPPTSIDPAQAPIRLHSKSAAMRDLRREQREQREQWA